MRALLEQIQELTATRFTAGWSVEVAGPLHTMAQASWKATRGLSRSLPALLRRRPAGHPQSCPHRGSLLESGVTP